MAAAKKEYTVKDLKKAFEAGAKSETTYKGNNSFDVKKVFNSFDDYKKTLIVDEDEKGEE